LTKIEEIVKSPLGSDRIVSPTSLYLKFQNLSPEEKRYINNEEKKRLGFLEDEKKKINSNIHKIRDNRFDLDLEKLKKKQNIIKDSFNSYNKKPERIGTLNIKENSSDKLISSL
jgi:hypothetical protein